jgi:hypothetical protein
MAYSASALNEPWSRVWVLVAIAIGLGVGVASLGCWLDRIHWRSDLCDGSSCHWFARSGAFIVALGTCLAFKSGSVLIKRLEGRSAVGPTGLDLMRPNPRQSTAYGLAAWSLLVLGTLIWAFGDLWRHAR